MIGTLRTSRTGIDLATTGHLMPTDEPGDRRPFPVVFVWDRAIPVEVVVKFGKVPWAISRDILAAAPAGPAGYGDVVMQPAGDDIVITLTTPDDYGVVAVPLADVVRFVTATIADLPLDTDCAWPDHLPEPGA